MIHIQFLNSHNFKQKKAFIFAQHMLQTIIVAISCVYCALSRKEMNNKKDFFFTSILLVIHTLKTVTAMMK